MRELTTRQRDVLDCLIEFCEDRRMMPTRAELAAAVGCNHQRSIDVALKALEKKRYIQLSRGKHRGIEILRNY